MGGDSLNALCSLMVAEAQDCIYRKAVRGGCGLRGVVGGSIAGWDGRVHKHFLAIARHFVRRISSPSPDILITRQTL